MKRILLVTASVIGLAIVFAWLGVAGGSAMFLAIVLVGYGLPSVVAYSRQHRQREAILLVNVLLGWTGLGWVVALVWAVTQPVPAQVPQEGR
jgi:Superinfection immunity protein